MQELIVAVADGVMAVPHVDVVGTSPGPHLALIAGVHGAEYTSVAANLPAFWEWVPFVVRIDAKNLNRNFPGVGAGAPTEVLAHHVTETFIRPTCSAGSAASWATSGPRSVHRKRVSRCSSPAAPLSSPTAS